MKEKGFSGPDLPLFSSEASVQLAFLTLIEAQKSSRELHLIFVSLFDPTTNTPFYSAYKVLPEQAEDIGTKPRPKNKKWRNPPGT